MIMFGSFLPSLGWLAPPKFTRAWEPTLSWNQLRSKTDRSVEARSHLLSELGQALSTFLFPPLVFSRAPLRDENAVAVRIRNRDFTTLHIGRPMDFRYFDAIREQVLA